MKNTTINDDSYYLTPEAAAEQEKVDSERQLRNSQPTSMSFSDMITSDLYQPKLSAKHLIPEEGMNND